VALSTDTTPPVEQERRTPGGRLSASMRHRGNWVQLVKFGLVGASGFAINTGVYWVLLRKGGLHYIPAAIGAFAIAVANNFFWNRTWTFRQIRHDLHTGHQFARFLTVSVIALGIDLVLLRILVEQGNVDKIIAQMIAVVVVTPISFLGNRLWSFRRR
jgi:dolichol-phosphate mannosyltransferase